VHLKRNLQLWHARHNGSFALLSDAEKTDTAVVFVHGFYGDASSTWQNFERLILDGRVPASFKLADFFFYRYPSSRDIVEAAIQDLGDFLSWVFPTPSISFLQPSPAARQVIGLRSFSPRATPIHYSHLVLLGHSFGGVLVRGVVAKSLDWRTIGKDSPIANDTARSTALGLFAPAQYGFRLREELARVFQIFKLEAVSVVYSTFFARAYKDLTLDDGPLKGIEAMSLRLAAADKLARGVRPVTMWARGEIVVPVRDYDGTDFPFGDIREGHTHTSICKPTDSFPDPINLVDNALERVRQPLPAR